MKKLLLLQVLAISLLCQTSLVAQTPKYRDTESGVDRLTIERTNGQQIEMTWTAVLNIKKQVPWQELLRGFQTDFAKVVQDIPVYNYCSINYIQGESLVVDEVVGQETYTVNERGGFDYVKSNACRLQGKDVTITIAFDTYDELQDEALYDEVQAAVEKIKHRFYISNVTAERYIYSATSQGLVKPPVRLELFVPGRIMGGVFRNRAFVELGLGVGVAINDRNFVALGLDYMTTYAGDIQRTESDTYLSLRLGELGSGATADIGFNIRNGIRANEGVALRAGLTYTTKSGMNLGARYYISERTGDIGGFSDAVDFDFGIGWSF